MLVTRSWPKLLVIAQMRHLEDLSLVQRRDLLVERREESMPRIVGQVRHMERHEGLCTSYPK